MPGDQVEEGEELLLMLQSPEVVEGMVVVSVEKRATLPGNAQQEVVEEATTNAGIASKRVIWLMTAQSQRSAEGVVRRVTRWQTVPCHRSASIAEKKDTLQLTVQNLPNVGGARRRVIW